MLKRKIKQLRRKYGLESKTLKCHYKADGLGVRNKEIGFLEEPVFKAAWQKAVEGAEYGFRGLVPDIRWRARIALWAARRAVQLEGDFVECGVYTGLLSLTICHALTFAKLPKKFYLFDTFEGIPMEGLTGEEKEMALGLNRDMYRDVYDQVRERFAPFPNAILVRGSLPGTLDHAPISKIAYLSVDLNNAAAERPCIERLWPLLAPGAVVVVDDYAFAGHRAQYDMWNAFSAKTGSPIATLPTGQGLMIHP